MVGRKFAASDVYRYGFNGKENDNDVKGEGNQQDYGMRVYDPRVGRFLSLDPLVRDFPYYSTYHFAGCSPIKFIDLDGGEPQDYIDKWIWRPIGYAKTGKVVPGTSLGNSYIMVEDPELGYVGLQLVYDKTSDQNWFVHHHNNGKYYYYKADDGQHNKLRVLIPKNGLAIVTGGSLQEFETQDAIQARIGGQVADMLSVFFAVNIGGAMGGGMGWAAVWEATAMGYWKMHLAYQFSIAQMTLLRQGKKGRTKCRTGDSKGNNREKFN